MHVGHINVNNEKMAKSLGNFVLVKDLLIKYTPNDLR
jgi:cysteinyl-tRNA synthetase